MVDKYSKEYSADIIAGYHHGYFTKAEEKKVVESIKESNANMIFVGISSPKKERFINTYKDQLESVRFLMGVGGSFDVIAGCKKRAPKLLQNIGCEWLWRFAQEPLRLFRRYTVGNFKFICLVAKEIIK